MPREFVTMVKGGYTVDRPAVLVVPPWAIKVSIVTAPFVISNLIKLWRRWRAKVGKVVTITHETDLTFGGSKERAALQMAPVERRHTNFGRNARTLGVEIDFSKKEITLASFFAED